MVRSAAGGAFAAVTPPPAPVAPGAPGWAAGTFATQIVVDPVDWHTFYVLDNRSGIWQGTYDGGSAVAWQFLSGNLLGMPGGPPGLAKPSPIPGPGQPIDTIT